MPTDPHRHDHTRCVQTPAGPVHPDDYDQPHERCEPDGHPHGLSRWDAATYAVVSQLTPPNQARHSWQRLTDLAPSARTLLELSAEQITEAVRPSGLANRKAKTLIALAEAWGEPDWPYHVEGFGTSAQRVWASTMRP